MARYTGPRCKLMRREGMDLSLVTNKLDGKCNLAATPGRGVVNKSNKLSNYGMQLREKQKVKRIYGMLEKQFRIYFDKAERKKGSTSYNLLMLLESRLDNIIYRMGFANTRAEARQLVSHKAVSVNGKVVNIPSFQVKNEDIIAIVSHAQSQHRIIDSITLAEQVSSHPWLEINYKHFTGKLIRLPERAELVYDVHEEKIVAMYSK